ncbi:unnamed protein product [Adineta ricciae]|uniref:G-protein coupled receptors family 1 profile domain-containing protein n=1 Tax=Adineta ricciae TaxID=249248 RepID=A0A815V8U7_ADIRI|nr:unnamed protein product [Adineta ricciae]CAF1607599.1 unnamed protein product [Adineta ricciae]
MSSIEIVNFSIQYSIYNAYIIISLGMIGNLINLLVFTRLKLFHENRSVFFLKIEFLSNLFYEFLSLSLTILTSIYGDDGTSRSNIWCKMRWMLAQIFLLIGCFMICCASADQYFSTHYYFYRRQFCTIKFARYSAVIILCLCLIHSITFALFFSIKPLVGCVIFDPNAVQYASFFFYPVLTGFLPMIISGLFSLFAYQNVRRIIRRQIPIVRRHLDQQMSAMVFLHVIFFIILIFPYSFYRIYSINNPIPRSQSLEYAIRQLLQTFFQSFVRINTGINFYLFYFTSSRFRRQVKIVLIKKYWNQIKHLCSFNNNNQIAPEISEPIDTNNELDLDHK